MDERALAERLISYDSSTPDGVRNAASLRPGLARVARDRPRRARLRRPARHPRRGRPADRSDRGPARPHRRRPGPQRAVRAARRGRPAHRPRRLRHEGRPRRDDVRARRRGAPGRGARRASCACPTRRARTSSAARPTRSSPRACTGDFAITGEPTDLHIGVQAKGVLAIRLAVFGTAAHGSTPWLGDNAILKAHDVFRRIETLPFSRESSELFDRPSISLNGIAGGDAFNKVPDRCEIDVDIRYLPNQEPEAILDQIRAIGDLELLQVLHARARDRAPRRTRTCSRCVTRSAAPSAATRCRSAATAPPTPCRSCEAGVPAVEFGPVGGGHHGPQEWVSIASLGALPERARRLRGAAAVAPRRQRLRRPSRAGGFYTARST